MKRRGEAGIKSLVVTILLVGLFAYAIISVGVQMAEDNDANQSIIDHPIISASYGNISEDLTEADKSASGSRESLEKGVPEEDKFNPIVAIWGTLISVGSMVT